MASLLLALLLAGGPPARRIVVAPGSPVATVAEGLRRARPGDTVFIAAGVYRESGLEVRVPLTLLGQAGAVLDGSGRQILTVRADGVTIRGLTLRHVAPSFTEDRAAIRLDSVANCVVADNRLLGTFFAIYASRSSGCTIRDNLIEGRARRQIEAGNAIHLFSSRGFTVADNRISGHRDGIYLEFSPGTAITGNDSRRNVRYGLHFMFSDSCEYRRNVFAGNVSGVAVMYSHRITMIGNRFEDNWGPAAYGLLLKEIKDSRIEGNILARNTVGLFAESADRAVVVDNQFLDNGWAIRLMADATDDVFRGNRFAGNTFDVATNSRSSSASEFTGNYWDGYRGYDLDRDGFGDVPFRPVRLASVLVEQNEPMLILLRSFFLDLLESAERVMPVLTPDALADRRPLMRWRES
ncbi:MAG TPA: nitrous oxide reductase family maturation protein NosD [Gemmatimonadales bacterium]|nr:nitrous oxide reductase family maturation protein NosD [Gemmatimonadales bacterium]